MVTEPSLHFIYHLLKVHRSVNNPPGQFIISSIGSLTSNLSNILDLHLQKWVVTLPTYLKDSTQLIKKLQQFNGIANLSHV